MEKKTELVIVDKILQILRCISFHLIIPPYFTMFGSHFLMVR